MAEMGNPNVIQYNYTYMVACDMQLVHGNYNITNNQTLAPSNSLASDQFLLQCFNYQDDIGRISSTLSQKVIKLSSQCAGIEIYLR